MRSEEHTSELQSHSDLHSFPHDALPICPHPRRGTSRRARASGGAAEAGCILMTHLPGRLSHERDEMCSMVVRRASVVTRVHVAWSCCLSEQADAHEIGRAHV